MKVIDLKRIIEVPIYNSVKTSTFKFSEYINIKEDTNFIIQSFNGISFVERIVSKDFDLFTGCVLVSDLMKFLNTLKDDDIVTFKQEENNIIIKYGKKSKFAIKSIPVNEFPNIDFNSLTENKDHKCLEITSEILNCFSDAINYCNKRVEHLNGLFINDGNIYSTDRSVLYKCITNIDTSINTYMPVELVKFIIKFGKYINEIKFYDKGFSVIGDSLQYWYSGTSTTLPNFQGIYKDVECFSIFLEINEELKNTFNRISEFNEVIQFRLYENNLDLNCDNISETFQINESVDNLISFKISSKYIKNASQICNSIVLYKNLNANDVKFIKCADTNKSFEIVISVII